MEIPPNSVRIEHPSEPGVELWLPRWLFERMVERGYVELRSGTVGGGTFRISAEGKKLLEQVRKKRSS